MTALEKHCISLYRCGDLTQPDNHFCVRSSSDPLKSKDLAKPNHVATASIKKPIHNVKEACISKPYRRTYPANRYSSSLEISAAALRTIAKQYLGGAYRDRTDDLMLAKQPLSQLS